MIVSLSLLSENSIKKLLKECKKNNNTGIKVKLMVQNSSSEQYFEYIQAIIEAFK